MDVNKKIEPYTIDELAQFVHLSSGVSEVILSLKTAIQENASDYWNEINPPYFWSGTYERPLVEVLAVLAEVGGPQLMSEITKDRRELLVALLTESDESPEIAWDIGNDKEYELRHFIGALYAMLISIESLGVYGKSIYALLQEVKAGVDKSLFDIVRLDRSAISAPTIADRITRAELEQDERFFKGLVNALSGKPHRRNLEHKELRFLLALLNDLKLLDILSIDEIRELVCNQLELYPYTPDDVAEGFDKFLRRWKREYRT